MPKSKTANTTHILLTIKNHLQKYSKTRKIPSFGYIRKISVGANSLINLNKGWKLNNNGLYTYYVEKNGTVSVKISNGKFRVWNGKDIRWDKKDLKIIREKFIPIMKNLSS